ncbi:MAG TPA: STAS domain-containing protein [Ktedonobacterales bacterium]|nr:STAS domain-containing protein [Ktedonobacterales bacterium]
MSDIPANQRFAARVRQATPQVAIVALSGEINAYAETALNAAYAEAAASQPTAILLNCAAVDYINSTGIALIVGLLAQTQQAGRALLVCGLSEHYVELFTITRLADYMRVFPDEATALASMSDDTHG